MIKKTLLAAAIGMSLAPFSYSASLLDMYHSAQKNNPVLKKALADSQQIMEGKNQAESALLPQLNASADYSANRYTDHGQTDGAPISNSFAGTRTYSLGLNLSQVLFNMKAWKNLNLAEKTSKQAVVLYQANEQNLIYRVASAYLDVLKNMDNLTTQKAQEKNLASQLRNTRNSYNVGVSTLTDLQTAQAEYDSVVASRLSAESQLQNSLENLATISGVYPDKINELNVKRFKSNLIKNKEFYVKEAQNKNLTLLYTRMSKELAKQGIDIAQSSYLPTVNLVAGYNYIKSPYSSATAFGINDRNLNQATIGIQVSMPLYTGGRTSSEVRQQEYAYMSSSEALRSTQLDLTKNIRSTVNSLNTSVSSINAFKKYVVSSRSAYNSTLSGYNNGTNTIQDLLNSIQARYQAESNLSNARYDYLLAQLQLKQLSGTLNVKDLESLNSILNRQTKVGQY